MNENKNSSMGNDLELKNASEIFISLCAEYSLPFSDIRCVRTYDETTLFCPAGMQQFKNKFSDCRIKGETVANIQTCLRMNDLSEIGDGSHSIVFRMLGLFSFRHWSMIQAVGFFHEFLSRCGLVVAYVTIHPDKWDDWQELHPQQIERRQDQECKWSDGTVGGYCTEFYVRDASGIAVEVGNVVNPLNTCIDAGFGMERIDRLMNGSIALSRTQELEVACWSLLESGFLPAASKQGYVLRKLLRMLDREEGEINHPAFLIERSKRKKSIECYQKLLPRNREKSAFWWWDTHGVDVTECEV